MSFPQITFFILIALFFLSGCTAYDTVRHNTFTMRIPQWEQQDKVTTEGIPLGFFTTDSQCHINLTFSLQPLFAAVHTSSASLSTRDKDAILDSTIYDTVATFTYRLAQPELQGKLKVLACPLHYTYVVDYSCPPKAFAKRQSEVTRVLESMTC